MRDNAWGAVPVGTNDHRGRGWINPLGAEHGSCRQPPKDGAGGQPRGFRLDLCGELDVARKIDVAIDQTVMTSQTATSQLAISHRRTAEETFHAATVAARTDESGPPARFSGRTCA